MGRGSGKHRSIPLLFAPEALQEPPGGPVWRRPFLAVAIGIGIVVGAIALIDVFDDGSPEFRVFVERSEDRVGCDPQTRCFSVTTLNVGGTTARARCTWQDGSFTTLFLEPNETSVVTIGLARGVPRVRCLPLETADP